MFLYRRDVIDIVSYHIDEDHRDIRCFKSINKERLIRFIYIDLK